MSLGLDGNLEEIVLEGGEHSEEHESRDSLEHLRRGILVSIVPQ